MSDTTHSTLDPFDRTLGGLDGLPGVLQTGQTTVQSVTPIVGKAETFIVQTVRQPDTGDTIFLQCIGGERSFRLVIPPKVAAVIARQRDALTGRARRKAAQAAAQTRKERGIEPAFLKRKRRSK